MKDLKLQEQPKQQTQKQPYDPPKATFVPIKSEDRPSGCDRKSYRILVACRM